MKNITTMLLILLTLIISCKNEKQKLWIISEKGLHLREKPDLLSKSIILIPFGEEITKLNDTEIEASVDKIGGNWINVNYNNNHGWVFDAFVNPFVKYNKLRGSISAYGLSENHGEMDHGKYSLLKINNKAICLLDDNSGLQFISDKVAIFQKFKFVKHSLGNQDNMFPTIENYYLIDGDQIKPLKNYLKSFNDIFSSPSDRKSTRLNSS